MNTQTKPNAKATLSIGGMACSGCANTVHEALINLEGVQEATINLDNDSAAVTYNADAVSPNDFVQAIEDAGYEFNGLNKLNVEG